VSGDYEDFWSSVPVKAEHPRRIPMLEAFRWIAEPLSAVGLVDVLDGDITMWEAAHHLGLLEALGVVKPCPADKDPFARRDAFDLPYRLVESSAGEDG
jgi:hypothetical protein